MATSAPMVMKETTAIAARKSSKAEAEREVESHGPTPSAERVGCGEANLPDHLAMCVTAPLHPKAILSCTSCEADEFFTGVRICKQCGIQQCGLCNSYYGCQRCRNYYCGSCCGVHHNHCTKSDVAKLAAQQAGRRHERKAEPHEPTHSADRAGW